MKTSVSQNEVFYREAEIEPIEALPDHFTLKFHSVLLSARSPNSPQRNFEAILDRQGVESLRDLLDAILQA